MVNTSNEYHRLVTCVARLRNIIDGERRLRQTVKLDSIYVDVMQLERSICYGCRLYDVNWHMHVSLALNNVYKHEDTGALSVPVLQQLNKLQTYIKDVYERKE